MTGKNPTLAELGLDLAALRKYKVDIRAGVFETDGSPEEHARLMEAMDRQERLMASIERIGMLPPELQVVRPTTPEELAELSRLRAESDARAALAATARAPVAPVRMLASVAESWIAERRQKNKPRTVYAKECHFSNFAEHLASLRDMSAFDQGELATFKARRQELAKEKAAAAGNAFRKIPDGELEGMFVATKTPMASIDKTHAVAFKAALLAAGQKAKTVDNKLLTLSDFFEYAIGNGAYVPEDRANPVSGTLILTKTQRLQQAEHYKPFTPEDLARIFEPAAYKAAMGGEPDLYWCPLIALYSGMRISEATGIYCEDVSVSPNGVDIVFVRDSKTSAGIRDVPIAQALIDLGFLDFVAKQRAAGHARLFPDRLLINETYSKELGIAFRDHLIAVGVRKFAHKSERKSFHSFRANVITLMRMMRVDVVDSMRIVGHSAGAGAVSGAVATHLGYVHELPDLKEIVDAFVWPIDLAGLQLP